MSAEAALAPNKLSANKEAINVFINGVPLKSDLRLQSGTFEGHNRSDPIVALMSGRHKLFDEIQLVLLSQPTICSKQ